MKTVTLSEPLSGIGGKKIAALNLREPRYADFMELDMPTVWVAVANGGGFQQESPSALRAWVERLVDCDPNLLVQLNLRDTLDLRDAVLGFFQEAMLIRQVKTPSTDSPASSSSSEDGTRGPSKI